MLDFSAHVVFSTVSIIIVFIFILISIRSQSMKEFISTNWINIIFFSISIIGIGVVWNLMSKQNQTQFESQILSFLLFIFSVASSWIFSKIYSEQGASRNLRDYSVQVARGVMVLQSQIELLSNWVTEKRVKIGDSLTQSYFEHIEETLRGFGAQTDASLRGLSSVMGDALKQYQETMDEIGKTRAKASKEAAKMQTELATEENPAKKEEIFARLQDLEERTKEEISKLSQKTSLPIAKPEMVRVPARCPVCGYNNIVFISNGPGQTKACNCPHCGSSFNLHCSGAGDYFTKVINNKYLEESPGLKEGDIPNFTMLIGHNYSKKVFFDILDLFMKEKDNLISKGIEFSIRDILIACKSKAISVGLSSTQIIRFVNFLYRGRLFEFRADASRNSSVINNPSQAQVLLAYMSAAGYYFGNHGWNLSKSYIDEQVQDFFSDVANDTLTIASIKGTFMKAYENGRRAKEAGY